MLRTVLSDFRSVNAHGIVDVLTQPECAAVRQEAFEMIRAAPGRDVPPMAWRVALLHAITPLAPLCEPARLLVLAKMVSLALTSVDWDHVRELMDKWKEQNS